MQGAPFSIVVVEVLKHTPAYVLAILAGLLVLGGLQMRDQVISRGRVLLLPVMLGIFSLWSALGTFGAQLQVLAAWLLGMAVMLSVARRVTWPREVESLPQRDAFAIGGSVGPLIAMLLVFAARYAATVSLVLNPQWHELAVVGIIGGLAYGLLAGVFAMRARSILARGAARVRLVEA